MPQGRVVLLQWRWCALWMRWLSLALGLLALTFLLFSEGPALFLPRTPPKESTLVRVERGAPGVPAADSHNAGQPLEEEEDTAQPVEEDRALTPPPLDPVAACRSRAIAALEKLEVAAGCMHCQEVTRISKLKSTCRRYWAEGRMTRTQYKNVLGQEVTPDPWNVTFVTQLSLSRFDRLELVAKHWQGAISAAIYVDRKEAWSTLLSHVCSSPHLNRRTNVIYHFLFKKGEYYPNNILRNLALDGSSTEWVFLVDVDLVPKPGLDFDLYRLIRAGQLVQNKTAWIVPAFEVVPDKNTSDLLLPSSKEHLLREIHRERIRMFHSTRGWIWAYNATLYPKWMASNESYEVEYARDFEPYVLMKKPDVPRYHTKFLSRYRNKVSHLEHIYYRGYRFVVLPHAYVVHLPHEDWAELVLSAKKYYACAYRVYKEFRLEMKKKYAARYKALWSKYPKVWS